MLTDQQRFFYVHAGYSYGPDETPQQGRERCAKALAAAETWARDQRVAFTWEQDHIDSSDFSDESPAWPLWACCAYDAEGNLLGCIGGIDFGRNGEPHRGQPYRAVIEAEIALDHMPKEA